MPEENLVDAQVKALLDVAMDAVAQARMMLSRPMHGQRALPPDQLSAASAARQSLRGRYLDLMAQQSPPRIPKTGKKGIKILLRLLDEPDHYVSHTELAAAAGLKSSTSRAIKVYICHIRDALQEFGYSPGMIETGFHSYRVRSENFEDFMKFVLAIKKN